MNYLIMTKYIVTSVLGLLFIFIFNNCDYKTKGNSNNKEIVVNDTIIKEAKSQLNQDTLVYISQGIPGDNIIGYWLNIPKNYQINQTWPILLFFHGGGMGENPDINRIKTYGPLLQVLNDSLSSNSPTDLVKKLLIICPVLPENPNNFTLWIDNIEALDAILDTIITNYNGDSSRLYITGASRGGSGTWRFPKHSKHSVAAIVPVCGYYMDLTNLNALIDIPVWMTCNTGDRHYNNHNRAALYIEEHGGEKFININNAVPADSLFLGKKHIFTSFEKKGHDAWTETYASRQVYQWMLSFQNINNRIIIKN